MKRVIPALLLLSLLLSMPLFAACGKEAETAVTYPLYVNNTPLDSELFTYYLDEAVNALPDGTQEEKLNYAIQMCIHYVAVNSTFSGAPVELLPAEKKETSDDTNVLWRMYGNYYTSIGVSKQTFAKVQLNKRYIEKLRQYYFGEGGAEEVPAATLRDYLNAHYVAFRAIIVPKKTVDIYGNEKDRNDAQDRALREKMSAGLSAINNNGTGIESVYATFVADRNGDREQYSEVVTDGTDHAYSEEFVNAVRAIGVGRAAVMDYGDALYLVYREDIQADEDVFETYRDECLATLSENALLAKIDEIGRAYSSTADQTRIAECWNNYRNAVAKAGK